MRKRSLEQHEAERPNALRPRTGEPAAQKGVEPEASRAQVSLLPSTAELVAVLEAFDFGRDLSGEGGRDEPAARLLPTVAAHSAGPQTSTNKRATETPEVAPPSRTSRDVTPLLAWRDFFAQFRTPNDRYLVITAKDQASLYDFFKHAFAGFETVQVTMDRRSEERRPQADPVAGERPQPDRRSRPEVDAELRASGFAFVRSLTRPDVGRAGSSQAEQKHPPTVGRAPVAVERPRRSPFSRASSG